VDDETNILITSVDDETNILITSVECGWWN
jgi:hypothetical protein